MESKRATQAIIHLKNMRHNIRLLRKHINSDIKICMAVKANAYGHGAVMVVQVAMEEGIDTFGIACVQEGIALRQAGIKAKLLLFTPPVPQELADIVFWDITPLVVSRELAHSLQEQAKAQNKALRVHIKVDTGMGRIGCKPEAAKDIALYISSSSWLQLEGVCTHFPIADHKDKSFTLNQIKLIEECVNKIKELGINPGLIHAANSGAIIDLPLSYFDMVRPGIMLYGYYPSDEQKKTIPLKPVMEFCTRIVFLKRVKKDTPLSYGLTYKTKNDTVIATLAAGYGDGLSRLLSNRGRVLINETIYPIVGTICMDQCLVDLGSNPNVNLYDKAIFFGPGQNSPSAEDVAKKMGTIAYEVTCLITNRVPRIYLDS